MRTSLRGPALRGGALALLAAGLFGVSTPLVQFFGIGLGAFTTAALLYAGAAAIGALLRQPVEVEARLQRRDLGRLLAMAGFGAVIGPVALAWGLQRTSGTSASLMLTLEALFTAVLAWKLYHETMDRRVWAAMLLLLAGGVVLVLDQGRQGGVQLAGMMAVLLATAAWGVDNTLSRGVADRDPGQVVLVKATLAHSPPLRWLRSWANRCHRSALLWACSQWARPVMGLACGFICSHNELLVPPAPDRYLPSHRSLAPCWPLRSGNGQQAD